MNTSYTQRPSAKAALAAALGGYDLDPEASIPGDHVVEPAVDPSQSSGSNPRPGKQMYRTASGHYIPLNGDALLAAARRAVGAE